MLKFRVAAVAAMLACTAMLFGGAAAARAQTGPARLSQVVPLTGTAKNGKQVKATSTVERFVAQGDKVYSVGLLQGKLGGRHVSKDGVKLPASVANASAARVS